MAAKMLVGLVFLGLGAFVSGEKCEGLEVTSSSSYTSSDSSPLTHVPFVADFSLKCSKGSLSMIYARVPTANEAQVLLRPVIRSGESGANRFQVSWTVESKKAKSGDYPIQLFDEEGYSALKRALEAGESIAAVKPVASVVVSHKGAFNGHNINSELLATILSAFIFYVAYTSKSSLLA
uniref:Translocon-associated protein subunit delta n=1 Tax=Caligus rogercresseyi TaxID=217165 RepID=C1BQ25_CALRO|nr:Translocon-associated protein subunit delta precursor [Caligus rogercresseyi]